MNKIIMKLCKGLLMLALTVTVLGKTSLLSTNDQLNGYVNTQSGDDGIIWIIGTR